MGVFSLFKNILLVINMHLQFFFLQNNKINCYSVVYKIVFIWNRWRTYRPFLIAKLPMNKNCMLYISNLSRLWLCCSELNWCRFVSFHNFELLIRSNAIMKWYMKYSLSLYNYRNLDYYEIRDHIYLSAFT